MDYAESKKHEDHKLEVKGSAVLCHTCKTIVFNCLPKPKEGEMKEFILFWLTGKIETIKGNSISEAFALAGYGGGAINALDFYSENPEDLKNYKWVQEERTWKKIIG